ncbi:pilus assembly protein TadG-related protein [Leptothrix sp. BB-4]
MTIFFALMMVFLFMAIGLAIDTSRGYMGQAQLQNAADACALAAVGELSGSDVGATALARARAVARVVVEGHRVPYRPAALTIDDSAITYTPADGTATGAARVTCVVAADGWRPLLLGLVGVGERTFQASSTATLMASQTACALPMGLRQLSTGDPIDFGYSIGSWYTVHFGPADSASAPDFRWVEFDPDPAVTDAACSGLAGMDKDHEAACLVARGGKCDRPARVVDCSGSAYGCVAPIRSPAAADFEAVTGAAFNTRFGLYEAGRPFQKTSSPPDTTGFAYTTTNWTSGANAWSGSDSVPNFQDQRASHLPYTGSTPFDPISLAEHVSLGASRRTAVVPVVSSADWASAGNARVVGYACVLLLAPWNGVAGSTSQVEYLGNAAAATSPCVGAGVPGRVGGGGAQVPALLSP